MKIINLKEQLWQNRSQRVGAVVRGQRLRFAKTSSFDNIKLNLVGLIGSSPLCNG
ncbi:hypothetical protein [Liquorilactobacillus capillatus]|uniref:hypothetical protein n=1 Tax=Liquorilactobacillus capillatus TaxID=480931 RepID=UPI000A9C0C02|nr:hypothetical protein [Liquorilactobacillus capillatus]